MIERLRCRYVRAVILLFSVTTAETGAAQPKHSVSFSDEHVRHKGDSIFWPDDTIPTRISPPINSNEDGMSWEKLRSNLFSNDDDYDSRLKENRLCDIGDGYVYREGEKLETFDTRCGSIEYFPCYCDPDLEPPISCPYCGFHSPPPPSPELQMDANTDRKALSNADDFFCLKSGETSGPFVGRSEPGAPGSLQVCSCTAEDFKPFSTCAPPATQTTTKDDLVIDDDKEGDEDDVEAEVIAINNYSNSPSSRPFPIDTTPNNDEAIENSSNIYNSNSPSSGPSPIDTTSIVNEPGAVVDPAIDEPAFKVREPMEEEEVVSNNDIDLPSKRTIPIDKSANSNGNGNGNGDDVCTLVLEGSGETKIFQRGESYGTHLPSKCSRPEDFPCFCNPDLYDQIECPHCGFLTGNGTLLCARHEKTVSFPSPGPGGGIETCTCLVSSNPALRPIEACTITSHTGDRSEKSSGTYQDLFVRDNGDTATHNIGDSDGYNDGYNDAETGGGGSDIKGCKITDPATGNNVTVPIGDSFADHLNVEGACGDGIEWPAYCSAEWSDTVDASAGAPDPPQHIPYDPNLHESNNLVSKSSAVYISHRTDAVYPYCIYTNTLSNIPVCARSNDGVVYTNDLGERIECFCTYSSISGSVSTCTPYPRETDRGSTRSYEMVAPGSKLSQQQLSPPQQPPTYSPVVTPTPPPPTFSPTIRAPGDYSSSGSIGRNTVGGCSVVFGTVVSTVVGMLGTAFTLTIL